MGVTVIGPSATTGTRAEPGVIVYLKEDWSDSWEIELELEPQRAAIQAGGRGSGTCELLYRYGKTKSEGATTFASRSPRQLVGSWVRLKLGGDQGLQTIWQGRIFSEVRSIDGSSWGPTGTQKFIAYDGGHILDKTLISTSWWDIDGLAEELSWLPSVNLQERGGPLTGNRNDTEISGSYLFGKGSSGYETWTHYEFLQYLLECHINTTGRPTWTISGETDVLKNRTSYIPLQPSMSVRAAIARLIDPKFGVDYVVLPTNTGFEIKVFALSWVGAEFGGYSLPENTNWLRVSQATDSDVLECTIERTSVQEYDHIRVVGERTKTVVTIPDQAKWTSTLQTAYLAGTGDGGDPAENHDAARADDRFRTAFQRFGAADTWKPSDANAQPILTSDGSLSSNAGIDQGVVRRTLPKLLLREGWDYTTNPPTEPSYAAGADIEEDFLPPLVLAYLADPAPGATFARWLPCDKLQQAAQDIGLLTPDIGVKALDNEWGVLLEATPNHVLAKGRWSGANDSGFDPDSDGGINYDNLKITIAIEGDHRLEIRYTLPSASANDDGSEITIECPGAEYWYLAPSTVVGVDADGSILYSPSAGVVLRNDLDKLTRVMAGAIARYGLERYRGRLKYRRLESWGNLCGQILMLIETGGADATQGYVGAPVTSVRWQFLARTTEISTGYAS